MVNCKAGGVGAAHCRGRGWAWRGWAIALLSTARRLLITASNNSKDQSFMMSLIRASQSFHILVLSCQVFTTCVLVCQYLVVCDG